MKILTCNICLKGLFVVKLIMLRWFLDTQIWSWFCNEGERNHSVNKVLASIKNQVTSPEPKQKVEWGITYMYPSAVEADRQIPARQKYEPTWWAPGQKKTLPASKRRQMASEKWRQRSLSGLHTDICTQSTCTYKKMKGKKKKIFHNGKPARIGWYGTWVVGQRLRKTG